MSFSCGTGVVEKFVVGVGDVGGRTGDGVHPEHVIGGERGE